MNIRYVLCTPVDIRLGIAASEIPQVSYCAKNKTMVLPSYLFVDIVNRRLPTKQDAAYWALHEAIAESHYPPLITKPLIGEAVADSISPTHQMRRRRRSMQRYPIASAWLPVFAQLLIHPLRKLFSLLNSTDSKSEDETLKPIVKISTGKGHR